MEFGFQKHTLILRGLSLNLSKSGTSWTVGGPGASFNVRGDKVMAAATSVSRAAQQPYA